MNPASTFGPRFWRDLIFAAVLVGAALLFAFFRPRGMSADGSTRALGLLMGLIVVYFANEIPKRLPRVTRCAPEQQQSVRRFVGWAMALGGLGYAVAWVAAPIRIAPLLAMLLLGSALTAVLGRITFVRSRS